MLHYVQRLLRIVVRWTLSEVSRGGFFTTGRPYGLYIDHDLRFVVIRVHAFLRNARIGIWLGVHRYAFYVARSVAR